MKRGAWRATVHTVAALDMTEVPQHSHFCCCSSQQAVDISIVLANFFYNRRWNRRKRLFSYFLPNELQANHPHLKERAHDLSIKPPDFQSNLLQLPPCLLLPFLSSFLPFLPSFPLPFFFLFLSLTYMTLLLRLSKANRIAGVVY